VDAVQRAEFFNSMKPDWHTFLKPRVAAPLTMRIRQAPGCPTGPNLAGCNYAFDINADGSCCSFILVENDTFLAALLDLANADIASGVITTKDITTALLPNTFSFFGDLTNCCVLGGHTYLVDPNSDPERRWVVNYSSWVSQNSFVVQPLQTVDIGVVSHEMTEIYNDPFLASDSHSQPDAVVARTQRGLPIEPRNR
jgi:hypothetical protein